MQPLLQATRDTTLDVMVRQAATGALGSVPSVLALASASALLHQPDVHRAALSAISRLGDARLARRHGREALAKQAMGELVEYAVATDRSTLEVDAVARAVVGCALTPASLQQAAKRLQKVHPALSAQLEKHARLQARRRR